MSIDELKKRIENLRELQSALMELKHYMETVEDLCGLLSIEGSHHAPIEYGRTEIEVYDELTAIEDRLSGLGVTV